ncbi:MAG: zinc metallopeptidase [Clostridia bacterium]|nr:zinc metallopeptidase [Clostridia bacterium]
MDIILYPLAIAAMIFAVWAQIKVSTTFNHYSRIPTSRGRTGAEVADMILRSAGINNVEIERVSGSLTDHYDPRTNTLRLSDSVYGSTSAAACGVAAHEAGHAIQHAVGYLPIRVRSAMVPVTTFASRFTWIVIMAGVLCMALLESEIGYYVTLFGIGLFATVTLFELVTLPCEFNASRRAMTALRSSGWYTKGELYASRKVLTAAALTYVAALAVSLIQLLRLIMRFTDRRR